MLLYISFKTPTVDNLRLSKTPFYHICHCLQVEILTLGPFNFQNSTFGAVFFFSFLTLQLNIQQSTNLLR